MPIPEPTDWPFDDPPNAAVITTQHVLDGKPIVYVSRDKDDGSWQFHSAEAATEADAKVVSLYSIVARDATIKPLADLTFGGEAERDAVGAVWHNLSPPA